MLTAPRLHHLRLSFSVVSAALFVLTTNAFAQVKQYTENKSDQALRSEARIDPATLGMSLEIPLGSAAGRAGTSVSTAIRYSSKLWRMKYDSWQPGYVEDKVWTKLEFSENAWSGWTSSLEPPFIEYTGREHQYEDNGASYSDNPDAPHNGLWRVFRIHLHLPDGSSHELRKSDAPTSDAIPNFTTGTYYSVNGTRMRFEADSGVLYLPDGGRYFFGAESTVTRYNNKWHTGAWASQYIDRNGNTINYSLSSVTDTLGRSLTNPLNDPANIPTVQDQVYSVPGVLGQPLYYTLRWRNLQDVLSAGQLNYTSNSVCIDNNNYQPVSPSLFAGAWPTFVCAEKDFSNNPILFNPVVLSEVVLPNGQKYQFNYNVFAEIDKIVYPTGGYERFEYGPVPALSDLIFPYEQANRGVINRWISVTGNVNDETHWTFDGGTITAPDGSYIERRFHGTGVEYAFGFNSPLEGRTYDERFFNSSGQMMRRNLTEWQVSGAQPGGYWEAKRDARVIKQVQLLLDTGGNALASATTTQHDADLNPVSTNSYDFASINSGTAQTGAIGSISLGTLIRTQETTYLVNDTSISSTVRQSYRDRQLLALPSSSRVKDGAGTIVAQSEIKYDESSYSLLTYGPVTGWTDPSTTVRGLPTTTRSWLNTTGGWVETHAQYDQCGSPRNNWDANGNQSQVAYSSDYYYAYPTNTISPDPDGGGSLLAHTTSTVYDFTTGRMMSTLDANSVTTKFEYNGSGNRLSQTIRGYGTSAANQTTVSYDDPNHMVTTTSDQGSYSDNALVSKQLYDGLGRTVETRQYEGGSNYIATQQEYDSLGRAYKTSNPFRPWQSESAVWTTTSFDALSRVVSVTTPDSAVVSTSYSGNQVTVTDQAGKVRRSITDGLGRLSRVDEPNASGSLGSVDEPNQPTSYFYDVLDNLTTVSQGSQSRTFVYDSLKRLTSASNPESGTISYQYDSNGNLLVKTDARSVSTHYSYDALNRAVRRWYNGSSSISSTTHNSPGLPGDVAATDEVTYTYDAVTNSKGRPTSVSSSASVTNYTGFDAMGRVTSANQVTDGQTYSMTYGYNLAGNQVSMTYPSGRVIATEYDAAGRTAGVSDQGSGIYYAGGAYNDTTNRIKYAAHGAVSVMKLGNGLWEHKDFNNRFQPTQIGLGASSTDSSTLSLTNNYGTTNNNGNLLSVSYAGGGLNYTQTFGYDELNRLTTSQEGSSWSQTNSYDRYGNRSVPGSGISFSASNNRITTAGYSYDSAGNLTNDSTQSFVFDAENRIKTVSGETDVYRYDGDGNRVRKNFTFGEKVRMVYSSGQLIAEYDLSTGSLKKEYVYGAKALIAAIEPSIGTQYTTSDHLGTPRVVTNSSAGVVSRHDYKPFGEELGANIGGRTTVMGFSVVDGVRQQFTSKERDNETGLDYFLARYYSNTQGRFTSPDEFKGGPHEVGVLGSGDPEKQALVYAEVTQPQSLNKYQYSFNNPLRYVDPDGHSPQDMLDIQLRHDEKELAEGRMTEKEFLARARARGYGALAGLAALATFYIGKEAVLAMLVFAARNPDKVEQIALDLQMASTGSPAPSAPGTLTLSVGTRLTVEEANTGARLAAQIGQNLRQSSHIGAEFISAAGKTYDAMGVPAAYASKNWGNGTQFFKSIVHHVNKSVDHVAIDLTGASKSQIKAIKKFVGGLTEQQKDKIIYVQ